MLSGTSQRRDMVGPRHCRGMRQLDFLASPVHILPTGNLARQYPDSQTLGDLHDWSWPPQIPPSIAVGCRHRPTPRAPEAAKESSQTKGDTHGRNWVHNSPSRTTGNALPSFTNAIQLWMLNVNNKNVNAMRMIAMLVDLLLFWCAPTIARSLVRSFSSLHRRFALNIRAQLLPNMAKLS